MLNKKDHLANLYKIYFVSHFAISVDCYNVILLFDEHYIRFDGNVEAPGCLLRVIKLQFNQEEN